MIHLNLAHCIGAIALVALSSGCEHRTPSASSLADAGSAQTKTIASHDCRAKNAQTTQKACKPIETVIGAK